MFLTYGTVTTIRLQQRQQPRLDAPKQPAPSSPPPPSSSQHKHTNTNSEPAPTPAAPSKRASATLSVSGPLKATVFSADGKRAASREGFLGDTLFKGDKLGTGQSVEVSWVASW